MEITLNYLYNILSIIVYVFLSSILFFNINIKNKIKNNNFINTLKIFLAPLLLVFVFVYFTIINTDYINNLLSKSIGIYYLSVTIIEESIKFIGLIFFIKIFKYNFYDVKNVSKIAMIIGLSFGTIENLFYLIDTKDIFYVFIARTFISIPLHMTTSLLTYIGIKNYLKLSKNQKLKIKNILLLLILILLPHTLFDIFLTIEGIYTNIAIFLIFIFAYPFLIKNMY